MATSSGGSARDRIVLARRPGFGSLGQKIVAVSNHYRVKFEPKVLYHYDVTIQSIGLKDSNKAIPKSLNREVMNEFFVQHSDKLGRVLPVYDGEKSLYTATAISDLEDVEVQLPESNDSGSRCKRRPFLVSIKKASEPDLRLLDRFLKGQVLTFPQEAIQALDIVLRELPSQKLFPAGRSFFSKIFGQHDLGGGIISWNGFYESIRVAQNGLLTLNLDITANAFIESGPLENFLSKSFRMDPRDLFQELTRDDARGDTARVKAKKLLKGIRIETNHNAKTKRKHRISSLSDRPLQLLTFEMNGENISICEYFLKTYNYKIRYPQLPAIDCGTRDKRTYFPIEVCSIIYGQNYTRKINQSQKDALSKITCCMPQERLHKTNQIGQDLISNNSAYLKEFGVMVNRNMTEVPARVLPPPKIQFRNGVEIPSNGSWNLRGKVLFQACKRIKAWSLINLDNMLYSNTINKFCNEFVRSCTNYGLDICPQPIRPIFSEKSGNIEEAIRPLSELQVDLLLCVMPSKDNKGLYARIKKFCDIDMATMTQCCLGSHVQKCHPAYLANVIMKINVKLGGRNSVLVDEDQRRLRVISSVPTMIIGADVSHPRVGDDSSSSIAAVAASMDWPYFSKYETITRIQTARQEILEDLFWEKPNEDGRTETGGIFKDLLQSFEHRCGYRPEKIIYYRDGVSDGQFDIVLRQELESLKKACEALGWNNSTQKNQKDTEPKEKKCRLSQSSPKVTFIVVQKKHHTRFFPKGKPGNVAPGLIVDSVICHPVQFDFYLCSHAGIKGTSNPAHYYVLKDENGFSADDIQQLTNELCFMYARCTRSVSIVPPCYYADLVAKRARIWIESGDGSNQDYASTAGSKGGHTSSVLRDKALPQLNENIKTSMFFI